MPHFPSNIATISSWTYTNSHFAASTCDGTSAAGRHLARRLLRFAGDSFLLPFKYNLSTIPCFVTVEMGNGVGTGRQLVGAGGNISFPPRPPQATPRAQHGPAARGRETPTRAPLPRPPPRPQPMSGHSGEGRGLRGDVEARDAREKFARRGHVGEMRRAAAPRTVPLPAGGGAGGSRAEPQRRRGRGAGPARGAPVT